MPTRRESMDAKQQIVPTTDEKPLVDHDEAAAIAWCERLGRKLNAQKSDYRPKSRGHYENSRR